MPVGFPASQRLLPGVAEAQLGSAARLLLKDLAHLTWFAEDHRRLIHDGALRESEGLPRER